MLTVTKKVVNSEDPLEHWSDIKDLENKIVLDLGCGWLFQPFQSTPEYFLSRGASKIIGVDASCGEIQQLNSKYLDHTFICKEIKSAQDIIDLLLTYKPNVIKMDIEGYESVMEDISKEQFSSVKEIAIEYHNPTCKEIIIRKLEEFGFEIFAINQFGWFCTDINQMGIMHAKLI
jgi:hypothetical protein